MAPARRAALVNNHVDVRRGRFPASFYVSECTFNESLDDYSPPAQVITYANFLATVTNSVSQELYSTIILTSGAMQPTGFCHFCQRSLIDCYDCYRNRVRFPNADTDIGNHSAASVSPQKNNFHQVLLCFSFSTFSSWNSFKIRVSASDAPDHTTGER